MEITWFIFPAIILFMFSRRRRRWGKWDMGRSRRGRDTETGDREVPNRQRDAQIDLLETRVAELESRLDYAERLLTQHREAQQLPADSHLKG